MMHEPKLGHDPAFAALRDCFDRCVVAPAGLDLDENQRTAAAGGDIDLAERGFPAPGRDPIAFGNEQHGGAAFRRQTQPEGGDAPDALPLQRSGGSARRAMIGPKNCPRALLFRQRQRTLIKLSTRHAGCHRDLAYGILERNAR